MATDAKIESGGKELVFDFRSMGMMAIKTFAIGCRLMDRWQSQFLYHTCMAGQAEFFDFLFHQARVAGGVGVMTIGADAEFKRRMTNCFIHFNFGFGMADKTDSRLIDFNLRGNRTLCEKKGRQERE